MCQHPPVTSLVCQIVHLLTCNMSASQLFNKRSVAFSRNYQLMYDVALTQIVDLQLQTLKPLEMAAVVIFLYFWSFADNLYIDVILYVLLISDNLHPWFLMLKKCLKMKASSDLKMIQGCTGVSS